MATLFLVITVGNGSIWIALISLKHNLIFSHKISLLNGFAINVCQMYAENAVSSLRTAQKFNVINAIKGTI